MVGSPVELAEDFGLIVFELETISNKAPIASSAAPFPSSIRQRSSVARGCLELFAGMYE